MTAHTSTDKGSKPRAARYDVKTAVRWTADEREEWRIAVELETDANPNGKLQDIAGAAMVHMRRPRPLNWFVIHDAGEIIKAKRAVRSGVLNSEPASNGQQTHSDDPRKPSEAVITRYTAPAAEPASEPAAPAVEPTPETAPAEAAPTNEEPAAEAQATYQFRGDLHEAGYAPEPHAHEADAYRYTYKPHAYEAPTREPDVSAGLLSMPHWTAGLIDDLVHTLVETVVRTAESPAVRKAIRSLIDVANDKNFKPEIDNTIVWEQPKVGPKLPRVLIVGFRSMKLIHKAIEQERKHLDLRFWRVDASVSQLRRDLLSADFVLISSYSNHTVRDIVVSSGKPFRAMSMASGDSMLLRELHLAARELRRREEPNEGGAQ